MTALLACPGCGDMVDQAFKWCPGCGKWLRLGGPTASDLRSRRNSIADWGVHEDSERSVEVDPCGCTTTRWRQGGGENLSFVPCAYHGSQEYARDLMEGKPRQFGREAMHPTGETED